ncbi:2,2-dialkylglycine decarboxylase [Fonsecaea pedrosoi]|nr:2,2-dialkylglycine decarboxylase [Fonsecaea pedrosoi]
MGYDNDAFFARADKYILNTVAPWAPTVITRTKGIFIYDADGKEIIDFTSGQMSASLGHCHPEIAQVVSKSITELDHLNSTILSPPVVDLAEEIAQLLPAPLEKTFFISTGSESVEAAINLAKAATGKFEIVAFSASYHGVTGGVSAATYSVGRKHGKPVVPGHLAFPAPNAYRSVFRTPDGSYDWETEMDYAWGLIDAASVGSLAGFVIEPILSCGGILEPPLGYFKRLYAECQKRGMLLIDDEAQTGVGRTGDMFAFERDGFVPDILALSKSLGCGIALSSVSTSAEIAKKAIDKGFYFGTTHVNDPLPCAVGCKVLEVVKRDGLVQKAKERGLQLTRGLLRLKEKYWCVGDVRGRGLLQGIEIIGDPVTKVQSSELGAMIAAKGLELGISCQILAVPGAFGVFRIAPPLIVSAEEIDRAVSILDQSMAFALSQEPYRNVVVKARAVNGTAVSESAVKGPTVNITAVNGASIKAH